MSKALEDVCAERQRQIDVEGWTAAHDDETNASCELACAAATYAICTEPAELRALGVMVWRWPAHWWKPSNYRRNLVKAGALVIAEIERIDRRDGIPQASTKLKVYLSGPMTGYPEFNYPTFERATSNLRNSGYEVFTPHEFLTPTQPSRADLRRAFAAYCKFICEEADTIILLPGWEKSLGVSAELALAKNCGLDVIEYKDMGYHA